MKSKKEIQFWLDELIATKKHLYEIHKLDDEISTCDVPTFADNFSDKTMEVHVFKGIHFIADAVGIGVKNGKDCGRDIYYFFYKDVKVFQFKR